MSAFQVDQRYPSVIAEEFLLSTGKKVTVYRCAYPSKGPVQVRLGLFDALIFMDAHFVFTRPEGTCRVHISHGTIERSWPLWLDLPIDARWSADSLVRFGRAWTHRHSEKFRPQTRAGMTMQDITVTCGQCAGKGCAGCDWTGTITIVED